jgi:hypothetical protein
MKRPERPSSVLVVAILQIAFGSLGLLFSLCGGAMQLAGGAKVFAPPGGAQAVGPDVEGMIRARVPYYDTWQAGGLALGVLSGAVMLVSGIGLLRMRSWARRVTIGYAFYNIVVTIVNFVFALTVTAPVMREVLAEVRADPKLPPQAVSIINLTETFATVGTYAGLALLAYPIILLAVMFFPHVREAFRAAALPPAREEEDGDQEYDDEPGDEESPPGAADEEAGER